MNQKSAKIVCKKLMSNERLRGHNLVLFCFFLLLMIHILTESESVDCFLYCQALM